MRLNLLIIAAGLFLATAAAVGEAPDGPATALAIVHPPAGFFVYADDDGTIQLYWEYSPTPGRRYILYRSERAGAAPVDMVRVELPAGARFFVDRDVVVGATYFYRLTAVEGGRESTPSGESWDQVYKKRPATKPAA